MPGTRAVTTCANLALAGAALFAASVRANDVDLRFVPSAANPDLPEGWSPRELGSIRPVRYTLVAEDGDWVLRADSDVAASTLARPIDSASDVTLAWRWKVDHSIAAADLHRRDGDDFAARVYVLFDAPANELSWSERLGLELERAVHGRDLPTAGLCYVWDNHAPVGTVAASAYTSRLQLIVLESGDGWANVWRQETRNLAADYQMAFGRAAPPIRGIAVMSDTDNTRSRVGAWYADLSIRDNRHPGKILDNQPKSFP